MHDKWMSDWVAKMYPGRADKERLKRVVEWDFMPDSFEGLRGSDFKVWKGMLCVGGTIEGCVQLGRRDVNGKFWRMGPRQMEKARLWKMGIAKGEFEGSFSSIGPSDPSLWSQMSELSSRMKA